eukprot:1654696-Pleurochrysis_carterae.AAC.3
MEASNEMCKTGLRLEPDGETRLRNPMVFTVWRVFQPQKSAGYINKEGRIAALIPSAKRRSRGESVQFKPTPIESWPARERLSCASDHRSICPSPGPERTPLERRGFLNATQQLQLMGWIHTIVSRKNLAVLVLGA